ncbi:glycosyltransferase, partial [Candidatus Dojkabacteria bacterium]|nr:glycosyltransferase [Candidatus Dojkabacteria bacterium]
MKNKYDIITISHFFYPRVGGLENMAFGIAKSLQKAGLNVFAIHAGETDFKYYLEGFAGESIKTINLFNNSYPITGLRFIYKIIKLLRSNPDATVLIHDRHVLSSVVASFICFVLNKPYILISHTTNSNYFKNKLFNKIGEIFESIFSQFVVGKAEKIIAVSKTKAKYLENNIKFDLE